MIVLDNKCKRCIFKCSSALFQQNFNNWTSGNVNIDKFIQDTQLSSHNNVFGVLEWIPYDKFYDIYIVENGYKAKWIDGSMTNYWVIKNENWNRVNQNMIVILKKLDNTKDLTIEFKNEV
jgi:hypothetical protein